MNVIQLISLVPVGRPPLIHDGKYYIIRFLLVYEADLFMFSLT